MDIPIWGKSVFEVYIRSIYKIREAHTRSSLRRKEEPVTRSNYSGKKINEVEVGKEGML